MTIVFNGTTGIETPGVTNSGSETIAGTLQVGGVTTNIYPLVSGTAVASTSGTSIDFTGIPSTAKRITVMFSGVSGNASSIKIIQIGTSGGIQTTGYAGAAQEGASGVSMGTNGWNLEAGTSAATVLAGIAMLTLLDAATGVWVFSSTAGRQNSSSATIAGGTKTLSGTLDRLRLTTQNGTDTFDAGSVNIMYE